MRRFSCALAISTLLAGSLWGFQLTNSPPSIPSATEETIRQLAAEQEYIKQALKDTQEGTRYLIGTFAALLLVLQVATSIIQARREDRVYKLQALREDELEARRLQREQQLYSSWAERDDRTEKRRVEREDRLDAVTAGSVQSVKNVLDVVHDTFQERREAEHEVRQLTQTFNDRIKELTSTIEMLNGKIGTLEGFAAGVRRTVENERHALERRALNITRETPRHLFRLRLSLFLDFARDYDAFTAKQEPDEGRQGEGLGFSVYVSYVRAIAAHFGNDPKTLASHMASVVGSNDIQPGEEATHRDKRRIVAHYYLGLTESNFGNYDKSMEHFQNALEMETTPKDILSRLAASEACVLAGKIVDANNYLKEIESVLKALQDLFAEAKKQVPISFRRLGYRATLIRANIAISAGREEWETAVRLLSSIKDPHEYYAIATLGQIYSKQSPESAQGKEKFQSAYMAIRDLGHLQTISEVRSKILLLLVAAMCAQHADGYTGMTEEHLTEAESMLASLPSRDGQTCTVFSPVSKRNENSSTILAHIDGIRRGVFLADS
jgi:tetratricopeptide (TPR) repeat protein